MDPIVVRILSEMEEMGYDQKTFAEKLGISPVTITDWKTGKSKSYLKKITLIAINLGTTTEYLLNGKGSAVSDSDTISEDDIKAAFWGGDKDLSQEDQDAMWGDVKRFAAFLAQQKKQEKRHD